MCSVTCVYSAAVRDVLISLASCWIQGTVHSYTEQSRIQQQSDSEAWEQFEIQGICQKLLTLKNFEVRHCIFKPRK